MYQKPDFMKVSVKVKDVFASYNTGCPHDEYLGWTNPCTTDDPNYTYEDFLALGWGSSCYSTLNP